MLYYTMLHWHWWYINIDDEDDDTLTLMKLIEYDNKYNCGWFDITITVCYVQSAHFCYLN